MKRDNLLICLCSLALMSGCQLATFNARPGVIVKSYPKELYGTYQAIEKHDGVRDTHILVINEKGAKMDGDDPFMDKLINLKDTTNTLSHLGDFYYLNVREKDSSGRPIFYVYPFEFDGRYLYVYTLSLGKTQKKMGKYLKSSGRKDGDYAMDNEQFKKYCERHLKKRKALKLKRIKS